VGAAVRRTSTPSDARSAPRCQQVEWTRKRRSGCARISDLPPRGPTIFAALPARASEGVVVALVVSNGWRCDAPRVCARRPQRSALSRTRPSRAHMLRTRSFAPAAAHARARAAAARRRSPSHARRDCVRLPCPGGAYSRRPPIPCVARRLTPRTRLRGAPPWGVPCPVVQPAVVALASVSRRLGVRPECSPCRPVVNVVGLHQWYKLARPSRNNCGLPRRRAPHVGTSGPPACVQLATCSGQAPARRPGKAALGARPGYPLLCRWQDTFVRGAPENC